MPSCWKPYMRTGTPMKLSVTRNAGERFDSNVDRNKQWAKQFGMWTRDREMRQ